MEPEDSDFHLHSVDSVEDFDEIESLLAEPQQYKIMVCLDCILCTCNKCAVLKVMAELGTETWLPEPVSALVNHNALSVALFMCLRNNINVNL
jgi:hypothetical protein